ncbi:MAG: trypsin-like peptidase domain-containing protein [Candidatus Marinimicrobia bacterium]|nr:trypsin-like peptidase domain-containing protein [Candidatus Neomarinimicrobiota bacterium]
MYKNIAQVIVTSLLLTPLFSQISSSGEPKSTQLGLSNALPSVILPQVDKNILLAEDKIEMAKDVPYRFGTPIEVQFNLDNSGVWEDVTGGRLWRLSIKSENAYSINLLYDRYILPEGSKLFIYNEDMTTVLGAFTHENNKDHETFSTSPTKGDVTILEYYEPTNVSFHGEIQINSVVHAYRDIFFNENRGYGDSGSCNNNVNCSEFSDWQNEVRAAAMILTSGGSRLCSGSLINNVRQDMTQYFLTANHCLGGESSWIFMFNYQSSGCSNQNGPTYQTVQGSTLLANNSSSDFGLLRLTETIPDSYDVNYAGWDATGNTPSTPVCIHHPSGDIKKITFDYDNASNAGNYWDIDSWDDGTTEPGSSGSPLFDGISHRIVGQLYGGVASCTNWGYDTYGKVSSSWNSGMSQYLDPDNTGTMVLDGIDMAAQAELANFPTSFDVSLSQDESSTSSLEISNIGEDESTLFYTIGVSPFENTGGGPDDNGNIWADSDDESSISPDWIDISSIGTQISFSHNDESADPINIGFDYSFYGESYSQCIVNANGWVGFGFDNNAWDNSSIPSTSAPKPAIFGFWDDLNPVNDQCNEYCSGNVYYHSNSERLVISFEEVAHWWTNNENSYYSFQVVLYSDGDLNLNYGAITGDHSATIGMQNADGTDGLLVSHNGIYAHADLSVRITGEPAWVSVFPGQGEVDAGSSESIEVIFSSEGLSNGDYTANLNISSNGGSASLPVSLEVGGGSSIVLGDINMDGSINIQDVILMVNIILDILNPTPDQFEAADLNADGIINVLDVIALVNIILDA